jgi:hypothetical protein
MRTKKRSDPSVLTAAIKQAADDHERASKRVEEKLDALKQQMRDSDAPIDELDESDLEKEEE